MNKFKKILLQDYCEITLTKLFQTHLRNGALVIFIFDGSITWEAAFLPCYKNKRVFLFFVGILLSFIVKSAYKISEINLRCIMSTTLGPDDIPLLLSIACNLICVKFRFPIDILKHTEIFYLSVGWLEDMMLVI